MSFSSAHSLQPVLEKNFYILMKDQYVLPHWNVFKISILRLRYSGGDSFSERMWYFSTSPFIKGSGCHVFNLPIFSSSYIVRFDSTRPATTNSCSNIAFDIKPVNLNDFWETSRQSFLIFAKKFINFLRHIYLSY